MLHYPRERQKAKRGAKMAGIIIGYLRVSTKKQGESGLGLEGQRAAVESYAREKGATVGAVYIEIETGKRKDRPELARALGHARRSKAMLVVAKLDRLARNVAFLSALMESKVPFVACDNPNANDLTLHILSAVAEAEVKAISARTKAALAAAKARGTKLGSTREGHWNGREDARQRGAEAGAIASAQSRTAAKKVEYADLVPSLVEYRAQGLSLREIAAKLNSEGQTTRRGKPWNPVQVARVLEMTG
jgi:DNA invertase Pin-like site-specific DNA recombinase